jgi:hypothetical protein
VGYHLLVARNKPCNKSSGRRIEADILVALVETIKKDRNDLVLSHRNRSAEIGKFRVIYCLVPGTRVSLTLFGTGIWTRAAYSTGVLTAASKARARRAEVDGPSQRHHPFHISSFVLFHR